MGYFTSPLGFPLPERAGKGRYDGPVDQFRTLYCSRNPLTCLRETMVRFRPSVTARAEFARFGKKTWPDVPWAWRKVNVLVLARIEILSGDLLPLKDQALLVSLEIALADLLRKKGIEYLTLAKVQEDDRALTQAIARVLFQRGAAGVQFPSKHDGEWCAALFEGRARLLPHGEPRPLSDPVPELKQVCREYGLVLETDPAL